MVRGGYEIQNYLSEKTLGDAAAREMEARFGIRYEEALANGVHGGENPHRAVVAGG